MTAEPQENPNRDQTRAATVRKWCCWTALIAALFAGSFWLRDRVTQRPSTWAAGPMACRRIVSLAPSVTEILFQLGLGDRVVGVSRYCSYPPEIGSRPRVGGLYDPNMEAIVTLRPDLVILPGPDADTVGAFDQLGLATLVLDHRDPKGIFDSIGVIGRACRVEREAQRLTAELRSRLRRVTEKTAGLPRPRVMLAVDHSLSENRIEDVYVAGSSRYFNPILDWAGGQNVFADTVEAFPVVSREAILRANPEVIVDFRLVPSDRPGAVEACRQSWLEIAGVDAVAAQRIHVVTDDYARVPGPRFILLVERLARLLHPEVDWQ